LQLSEGNEKAELQLILIFFTILFFSYLIDKAQKINDIYIFSDNVNSLGGNIFFCGFKSFILLLRQNSLKSDLNGVKVLSKATIYGMLALMHIASNKEERKYISIREISEELGISFHFLTKILQSLTEDGLLVSYRGPQGGIALNKSSEDIFLIDIVLTIEGKDFFDTCLLGLPDCGEAAPCPVHEFWKVTKEELKAEFTSASLHDLATRISKERLRLRG
jgi:Rrf2 family protein